MIGILIGCLKEYYKKIFKEYIIREGENHYNFSITYDHIPRSNIMGKIKIDLISNKFLDNQNILYEFYFDNNSFRDIFKEKFDRDFPVRNIYFHEERSEATILLKIFDIDSIFAFLRSFGTFRLGFR
jgi:hypothetical protein